MLSLLVISAMLALNGCLSSVHVHFQIRLEGRDMLKASMLQVMIDEVLMEKCRIIIQRVARSRIPILVLLSIRWERGCSETVSKGASGYGDDSWTIHLPTCLRTRAQGT
eukprot:TRINITY_DN169045_c0_g1_i1.p1 TRINITY_DN169045_c0_g1~~TRINITY_DN169045_c0_g1_i1.p1  ORF type:complete len:109 (-),score=2.42 TRINITY_DN169045_c0_g1_i1:18-344(-)